MATEQYSILKARGYRSSVVVRPSGSDSYWPPVGTSVPWVVARPIEALDDQRRALATAFGGWGLSGIIGNIDHLRLHGDHTPWSVISGVAKIRNILWAIDIQDPAYVEAHLLALCRLADYDTTWIHFFNINGSQYDSAGNRIASSGDYHLHVSAKSSAWDTYHTLLFDVYRHYKGWPLLNGQRVTNPLDPSALEDDVTPEEVWGYKIPNKSHSTTMSTGSALSNIEDEQDKMHARQVAMDAKLDALLSASGEEVKRDAEVRAELAALSSLVSGVRTLVEQGQSGDLAAEDVVRLIGERLTAASA